MVANPVKRERPPVSPPAKHADPRLVNSVQAIRRLPLLLPSPCSPCSGPETIRRCASSVSPRTVGRPPRASPPASQDGSSCGHGRASRPRLKVSTTSIWSRGKAGRSPTHCRRTAAPTDPPADRRPAHRGSGRPGPRPRPRAQPARKCAARGCESCRGYSGTSRPRSSPAAVCRPVDAPTAGRASGSTRTQPTPVSAAIPGSFTCGATSPLAGSIGAVTLELNLANGRTICTGRLVIIVPSGSRHKRAPAPAQAGGQSGR